MKRSTWQVFQNQERDFNDFFYVNVANDTVQVMKKMLMNRGHDCQEASISFPKITLLKTI